MPSTRRLPEGAEVRVLVDEGGVELSPGEEVELLDRIAELERGGGSVYVSRRLTL